MQCIVKVDAGHATIRYIYAPHAPENRKKKEIVEQGQEKAMFEILGLIHHVLAWKS